VVDGVAEDHDVEPVRPIQERHRRDDQRRADARIPDPGRGRPRPRPVRERVAVREAELSRDCGAPDVEGGDGAKRQAVEPPDIPTGRIPVARVLRERHEGIAGQIRRSCRGPAPPVAAVILAGERIEVERPIAGRVAEDRAVERRDERRQQDGPAVAGRRSVGCADQPFVPWLPVSPVASASSSMSDSPWPPEPEPERLPQVPGEPWPLVSLP